MANSEDFGSEEGDSGGVGGKEGSELWSEVHGCGHIQDFVHDEAGALELADETATRVDPGWGEPPADPIGQPGQKGDLAGMDQRPTTCWGR